jgi:diguanylate cyclase (GGDEF)-like protein
MTDHWGLAIRPFKMGLSPQRRVLSTQLRWIVVPLIVALTCSAFGISTLIDSSAQRTTAEHESNEISVGLAHGRIAGALYLAYAVTVAHEVDETVSSTTDAMIATVDRVVARERARLVEFTAADTPGKELTAGADAMIALVEFIIANPTADARMRIDHLLQFDETKPLLTTETGRSALDLATSTYTAPAHPILERAAAQTVLDGTSDAFPEVEEPLGAIIGGFAGLIPTAADELVDDADRLEATLPEAVEAVEFELSDISTLHRSAEWIEEFDVDRPQTPIDSLDEVTATSLAFYRRLDRMVVDQLERRLDDNRRARSDARDRLWTLGLSSVALALAAATIAAVATVRRHREIRHLHDEAGTDLLTGLPNRRAFALVFDRMTAPATRSDHAYFHVDIDDFKQINDMHGRDSGDVVLRTLARRLTTLLDSWNDEIPGVTVLAHAARLEGAEFAVAVHGVDLEAISAASMSEQLRRSLSGVVDAPMNPINVSLSVGGSTATAPSDIHELRRRADLALYDAKRMGRNRAVVRAHRFSVTADPDTSLVLDPHVSATLATHSAFVRELVILAERHAVDVTSTAQNDDVDGQLTSLGVRIVARPSSPFATPPTPTTTWKNLPPNN